MGPIQSESLPVATNQRFVSITFDDGLIEGARKAVRLLDEFGVPGVFYVVTGWVRPRQMRWIRERFNKGREHGDWNEWQEIQSKGHEVGSHTVTHLNAAGRLARWCPPLLSWELSHSRAELERHLGSAPSSISMPWNAPAGPLEPLVRRLYPACRLGGKEAVANDLSSLDWHRLHSWAPDSDVTGDEILAKVLATPPGHWFILQFHSFDNEGYMPITRQKFCQILQGIADGKNLRQVTVQEMIAAYRG